MSPIRNISTQHYPCLTDINEGEVTNILVDRRKKGFRFTIFGCLTLKAIIRTICV